MAGESGCAKGGTRGRSTVKRLPAAIRDAVDAAVEDGATIDEITALIRERGGECSRSAVGRYVKDARDLIGEVREFGRFVEEWVRAREPGAEGRGALVAIETLRMLMLHTMAALGARGEPASPEELCRLSLTLVRIERADKLRLERERAMAEAGAGTQAVAQAADMTHDERIQLIRRAVQERFFPNFVAYPEESEAEAAPCADAPVAPPVDTGDSPADGAAHDTPVAEGAGDIPDLRDDDWKERAPAAAVGPHDPAFCPWEWRGPG